MLSVTMRGRTFDLFTLSKQCTKCDGSGTLEYTRDATMNDLRDVQIKTLTEADIYRVSDGMTEEDAPDTSHSSPGGPTPSEAKAQARAGQMGGGMPNV